MLEDQEAILTELRRIVGDAHVLTGNDMTDRYDGYPQNHAVTALCIVRPANTDEVSAALRFCNDNGIAVVPHGGRTGLCAGGRATPRDVVISLERMSRIESVDDLAGVMIVEAGVQLQRAQEAAADAGLLYPVDLGARGSATIGGTIATNAGGNSVLHYGMTRDQILGLEAVLADGTVLSSMNRMIKNNAGFDLKQLFIGTEGLLGIVTRAVLRLRPRPGLRATALLGLPSFDAVLNLLKQFGNASDGALSSFEVMWPDYFEMVLSTGKHRRPLEAQYPFYVLAEISSTHCQETLEQAIASAWDAGLIEDATIASSDAQADALWAIRDDVEAMMHAYRPIFLYDVSLPQNDMEAYVRQIRGQIEAACPGAAVFVFGHIADGNLHVSVGTGNADDHHRVDEIIYGGLEPLGGSVSAEHGIGLEKRDYLSRSRSQVEIDLMRRLKHLLDPNGTLNPGKVI